MHCIRQERKVRRPPVMRNAERADSQEQALMGIPARHFFVSAARRR